ncbi:hypothetical protein [Nakamurella deserti]|uniref:hypothetical protein n=1 Tax=Nakamurella deserti TaxID=2164074 RepID=UPI000DBE185B|nr:hypothetical protein [Nakamurella deserti]
MPRRLMFVQLKSGHDTDQGPSWITWVDFNRTWKTARFHGRELRRFQGVRGNFADLDTREEFWLSGPKRDRTDARYSAARPTVDPDAAAAYAAYLAGGRLPGRETG